MGKKQQNGNLNNNIWKIFRSVEIHIKLHT